jgi:regulator of protease activity HflC (stomatin/prohibitin superfamily)
MSFIDRYVNITEYDHPNRPGQKVQVEKLNVLKVVTHAAVALVVGISALVYWPVRTVPTGSRGVITVGGAIKGIESEGFLMVAPWQSLSIFNIRAEEATVENAEGSTSDTQPVKVSLTVRYSIQTDKVAEVFEKYSHDGNLQSYVQTATQEVFKAVTSKYNAPDLIAKRALVSNDIMAALRSKLSIYGAQVINVDMRNFAFSESYMGAINQKVTQEQLRLAAENKVRTVEAEQKQKVAIAEAEASALRAQADGEAYSKLTKAKAEASALQLLNNAVAQNKDVLELKRIEVQMMEATKWNGQRVPNQYYGMAPIPMAK